MIEDCELSWGDLLVDTSIIISLHVDIRGPTCFPDVYRAHDDLRNAYLFLTSSWCYWRRDVELQGFGSFIHSPVPNYDIFDRSKCVLFSRNPIYKFFLDPPSDVYGTELIIRPKRTSLWGLWRWWPRLSRRDAGVTKRTRAIEKGLHCFLTFSTKAFPKIG